MRALSDQTGTRAADLAGPTEVFLHIGAHRTGTTSFQFTLGQNAQALAAQGLTVWVKSRGQVPNGRATYGVTSALHKHANGHISRAKAVKRLSNWIAKQPDADSPKVLMSDENFLGDMAAFFEGGGLYHGAGARLGVFADRFGPGLRRVVVVIRPLLDWIGSGAGYYALSGQVPDKARLEMLARAETRGWADIVQELRQAAPEATLCVADFRARGADRGDDLALASLLCPEIRLDQVAAPRNGSIPAAQMRDMQAGRVKGEDHGESKRKFSETDPDAARWRPDWPQDLRDRWDAGYTEDLDRIAGMPGVTLIRADQG